MDNYDSMDYRKYTGKMEFDKTIHTLEGILTGIAIDNKLNEEEVEELYNWCQLNRNQINILPFSDLIPLLEQSLEDGIISDEEKQDILWVCNNYKANNYYYDMVTSDLQRLQGILHGILSDNVITDEEIIQLKAWIEENDHLTNTYPYEEIYSLLTAVLADGKIDETERNTLKVFFGEFIDTTASYNINQVEIDQLKETIKIGGICATNPKVTIKDSVFCFTGASSKTTRSQIKDIVESMSGVFTNSITKKLNYLVIGDNGNPCWAFACYGRKVEKALEHRKAGQDLLIIHENDFWNSVDELSKLA